MSNRNDFGLEPMEKRLISLVVAGYTGKETTQRLRLTARKFRRVLAQIFAKLGVSNRLELILFVIHHGIVETASQLRPESSSTVRAEARMGGSNPVMAHARGDEGAGSR